MQQIQKIEQQESPDPAENQSFGDSSNDEGNQSANNQNQKKRKSKYSLHKEGKWQKHEDQIYVQFILDNRDKLASKTVRRSTRVFKQLAQILGYTRTPQQCRMHHQRMKKKARGRSITAIAKFIQKKYKKKSQIQLNRERVIDEREEKGKNFDPEATGSFNNSGYEILFQPRVQFQIQVNVRLDLITGW